MKNNEDEQRATTGNRDSKSSDYYYRIVTAASDYLFTIYDGCLFGQCRVSSIEISRDDFINTFNNFNEIFMFWDFFFINESVSRFDCIFKIANNNR